MPTIGSSLISSSYDDIFPLCRACAVWKFRVLCFSAIEPHFIQTGLLLLLLLKGTVARDFLTNVFPENQLLLGIWF